MLKGDSRCCKANIPCPNGTHSSEVCTHAPQGACRQQWCHAPLVSWLGSHQSPPIIAGLRSWPPVPQSNISAIQWSVLQDASCLISPGWNSSMDRCNTTLLPSPSVPYHLGRRLKPFSPLFFSFLQNGIASKGNTVTFPFLPGCLDYYPQGSTHSWLLWNLF